MIALSFYTYISYTLLLWVVGYYCLSPISVLQRLLANKIYYAAFFIVACIIAALPVSHGLSFYQVLHGLFSIPCALTTAILLSVFGMNYPYKKSYTLISNKFWSNRNRTTNPHIHAKNTAHFYHHTPSWVVILGINLLIFSSSLGWLPLTFYHYNDSPGIAIAYAMVISLFILLIFLNRYWLQVAWMVAIIVLIAPLGHNVLLYIADFWLLLYGMSVLLIWGLARIKSCLFYNISLNQKTKIAT